MKFLTSIVFLFSLLGCCAPQVEYHHPQMDLMVAAHEVRAIYIDQRFGPEEVQAIRDGIQAWNTALNGEVYLFVADAHFDFDPERYEAATRRNSWFFMQVENDARIIPKIPTPDGTGDKIVAAWADFVGGSNVRLVKGRYENSYLAQIIKHEIGHLLGAVDRERPGLMHWQIDYRYDFIDKDTLVEVGHFLCVPVTQFAYIETHGN